MFAVSTIGGGECMGACDTHMTDKGALITYPNTAFCYAAVKTTDAVRILNKPVIVQRSLTFWSAGASQPPSIGGVVSLSVNLFCRFRTGSAKVRIEGAPPAIHTSVTSQNNGNCYGVQVTASQGVVFVSG